MTECVVEKDNDLVINITDNTDHEDSIEELFEPVVEDIFCRDGLSDSLQLDNKEIIEELFFDDAAQSTEEGTIKTTAERTDTGEVNSESSHKDVGKLRKAYICLSCDDGADELATYTIPMLIDKNVPCTFGLYKTSPVFMHGYTDIVIEAVKKYNCEIAQHGGQHSWTDMTEKELVDFFNDEESFWRELDVSVRSAIYPTHLSNDNVRKITGSRFGCCRSGYNYDGTVYYTDDSRGIGDFPYYATGPNSNLYAMSSWNMPAGKDFEFNKKCIQYAIDNNLLLHFYWHDWDLDDDSKKVLEDTIDYAKERGIEFVRLGDIPSLTY